MAISASNLATTGSNVDATSYATASITPSNDKLILAWVYSIAATAPNTPTASGNSLTWVEIDNQIDSSSLRKITLFRALGTPSSGAVTFDFGGQTQTGAAWSIVEYTGMDTSGTNGSGAIVQSAKNASAGNATSLTVTLAAFGSADNATVGGFGIPLNTAALPAAGSGFTATGQRNQATPNLSIGSEFLASNDTSVDMTSAASSIPWVGIAAEIKQAVTNIDLVVNDLSTTPTLEAPALTQANTLTVADVSTGTTLENPALTQANTLTVADLSTTPTLEAIAVTQANTLTVADISSTPTLEAPTVTTTVLLAVNDLSTTPTFDNVALTQANTLSVNNLSLTPTLEATTVLMPSTESPIVTPIGITEEQPLTVSVKAETEISLIAAQTTSSIAANQESSTITVQRKPETFI